jgi:hypothetical protein
MLKNLFSAIAAGNVWMVKDELSIDKDHSSSIKRLGGAKLLDPKVTNDVFVHRQITRYFYLFLVSASPFTVFELQYILAILICF